MSQPQTMNFQDMFLRSRKTILEMLKSRGYNVQPYLKLDGVELLKLATGSPEAIKMELEHTEDSERKAIVKYSFTRIKQSLGKEIGQFVEPDSDNYVDVSNLNASVYIISFITDEGKKASLRIIKK